MLILFKRIIKVANHIDFTTKSKKERTIPMNKKIIDILNKLNNNRRSKYVFTKFNGTRFNADYISKQFKKSVKKANVNNNIHFHCLRHYFASKLVQKGISLFIVKELLGHEDLKTTNIYAHLEQKNLIDAINRL